jgi:dCTP deaminase
MNNLLSYLDLCELVKAGVIDADPDNINGASIDIRIGHELMVENPTLDFDDPSSIIDLSKKPLPGESLVPMTRVNMPLDSEKGGFLLRPHQFCLAHSLETFNLPEDICCQFFLRSSMARAGLNHLMAGWCDPGWHGAQLTLELHNTLQYHGLWLTTGLRIGQMVFHRVQPVPKDRSYAKNGRYNRQNGATSSLGA